jgi:serine-type D-Ala-D-Ala carboxypeptidase
MKKKSIILTTICSTFIFSSGAFAYGDASTITPTMEKQDKQSRHKVAQPHPILSWNPLKRTSNVLHNGSAKGAGMIEEPLREIDQTINNAISQNVMPGAVAFVAKDGHIVKHSAYGSSAIYEDNNFTEMSHPISMQKDTIFDLASISKLFTSTSIMILYEKGLLKLEDPVSNYIPEFSQNGKEQITIKQLLTHTSGFEAWIPLYTKGNGREERLQLVFKQPVKNKPGSTYTYSDLNMISLGAIVERLSGQGLDEYVKENITEPLKMKDTMYNPPAELKNRIAATEYQTSTNRGLVWGEVHDENAWSLDGVAGHAGVFSTASDLAKFAYIFINNGKYDKTKILSPDTVELLINNQIPQFPGNDHGLGWELGQGWYMDALSESTSFGHTGYTGTSIVVSPNNKTIAILLTNRVHPTRNTVSTNSTRRLFARNVADAIPVAIKGKHTPWFAGYGDQLKRTLEADVKLKNKTTMRFDTWHVIEENADYGKVEVLKDGVWETALEFTGNSYGWKKAEVTIPKEATKIRFAYYTDVSVNGRGWYIGNPKIKTRKGLEQLNFVDSEWIKRDY